IFHLHKDEITGGYFLIGANGEIIESRDIPEVLPFVILESREGFLELILGLGNHRDVVEGALKITGIAKGEQKVKGFGDLYFIYDEKRMTVDIPKFTDQSGGYYISNIDPLAVAKKESVKAAMEAVDLP